MAELSRCGIKRQKVAVVESSLTNIDVVSQLAAFLEAKDLCQVKATCKALGSTNDGVSGLSMADEATRRVYEDASDEEKATLPRHDGESWIELYHHLLKLRGRLTFDQLIGRGVEYRGGGKTSVQGVRVSAYMGLSQAICGNHIMRAGKHWATFTRTRESRFQRSQTVGVIRPLPGWETRGLDEFSPAFLEFRDLRNEDTGRWEGEVHFCQLIMSTGPCFWYDWTGDTKQSHWEGRGYYDRDCTELGLLLDLGEGTLSVHQNGRRVGILKDGLAGEYCWIAGFRGEGDVSIQRSASATLSTFLDQFDE